MVALSTTEVEYFALTKASEEVILLCRLLCEIQTRGVKTHSTNLLQTHRDMGNQWEPADDFEPPPASSPPTTILVDNQRAIKLAANPQFHNRMKYIDIRYHFIWDTMTAGEIILDYLPTADMVADIMTKPLPWDKHEKHSLAMGLLPAAIKSSQIANGDLEMTNN